MSEFSANRAAVLGLGIVGSRAVSRLVDAGWEVACWNRTPKGMAGEAASSEEAVEGAEIVSIYLKDAPVVREIFPRVKARLEPGQIVLNHSTVDLETTRWLAEECAGCGCGFLDAPFTGSKDAAGGGNLVYYIGGDSALADRVAPYLAVTSRGLLPCGGIGAATVIKLATNLISACTVQALAEALAISTRHGVAADCLLEAVSLNAHSSVLASMKLPMMAAGNFETHFSLSNMEKDSRYALALAEEAGLHAPAIAVVSRRMEELSRQGMGDLDFSALAKPYLDPA